MTEAVLLTCSLTAAARDSSGSTDHTGEKEASRLAFHGWGMEVKPDYVPHIPRKTPAK